MIKEAIEKVLQLSRPETVEVEGKTYSTKGLTLISYDPRPEPVTINTLTGLVDYVEHDVDELNKEELMIHVAGHHLVWLVSKYRGDYAARTCFIMVQMDSSMKTFAFGNWMDQETFIINLQSQFVDNPDRAKLLQLAGNMQAEAVHNHTDDGVTQTVKARKGIALAENVDVPNPVTLRPFRTFREIEQPASSFVFRVKDGREGEIPKCALFEADGAEWKLTAIQLIKEWLAERITDIPIIA